MTNEQASARSPNSNSLPTEIGGFDSLAEMALDLRWSWNHATDEVWRQLDPALWKLTQNPWVVLQTVSKDKLESALADSTFRKNMDDLLQAKRQAAETPAWFQQKHPQSPLKCVAYFSMEYMLSEALPIYSGGLGNVAGDQLKAAGDLGVPVVGVGLLYQQGYFRQVIDKDGTQQALYPYNDPGQLPITPLRQPDGEWLRLEIVLPGYSVWLRAWQVQVGRVKLYLLDSNDAANFPAHRGITSELYGGAPELRLKQEMLLGIGGINLSELDGWWVEAYARDVGSALGDGQEHGDDPAWDAAEADALYDRLEREVIPEFYTRNNKGVPTAWLARMRESMAQLTPRFSANRAVCEYTEKHYLPAAIACQARIGNKGAIGRQMVDWRNSLEQKWATLHFGAVKVETRDGKHIIEVQVSLHGLDPKAVRVELYADGIKENPSVRQEMTCLHPLADELGGHVYSATVSAVRPPADYTARVMPHYDGVAIPLEDSRILWQR